MAQSSNELNLGGTDSEIDAQQIVLDAPVVEVTVMEDRAHVVRKGNVSLAMGLNRIVVENVAPVLCDKTLCARINVLKNPATSYQASLEIDCLATSGEEPEIQIDYVVPGACWRPWHTAHLVQGVETGIEFRTDGAVWQNTGEDWINVKLAFSTERSSLGVEPPPLAPDVLQACKKPDQLVVETREQEIQTTSDDGGLQAQIAPELPGIDDGGEVLHLRAPRPATIPTDGLPYRVGIFEFTTDVETELQAIPELTPCAILTSKQTNLGSHPILAGPTNLVRDSGLVGRTPVLFIAPGESFDLGWGPDPEIRIKRQTSRVAKEKTLLSSWLMTEYTVKNLVSNLGPSEKTILVKERVPVSELQQVRIDVDTEVTTGNKVPDENGILTWMVQLMPFGHETVLLKYSIRKQKEVVGV